MDFLFGKISSFKIKNYFKCIKNGQDLDKDGFDNISRLVLREKLWCKARIKRDVCAFWYKKVFF